MKKIYILENLGCANCAAKIEKKINELPQVSEATITFATKQLRIDAEDPDSLLPQMQKIANSYEPEIVIQERKRAVGSRRRPSSAEGQAAPETKNSDGEECGCGHDHSHEEHEHHHHDGECGCGHDHSHEGHEHDMHEHEHHHHDGECGCGHDHSHEEHEHDAHEHEHHHHDGECGCGHDHSHEEHEHHHHDSECSCGHDHSHEASIPLSETATKKIYILENLGCANCAAKIEKKINELPQVNAATITFATKQLRVDAADPDSLLPQMQKIANSYEPEIIIQERKRSSGNSRGTEASSVPVHKDTASFASPAAESSQAEGSPVKKKSLLAGHGKELAAILCGAALFIAGEVTEHMHQPAIALALALAAYVILGGKVILTALKNIRHGQIFDENFLMSIATIGAFCIHEYLEAVGVMLFYRIGEFFEHIAVERSRTQIMDAVDLRPEVVNLVEDDKITVINAEEALVGDVLLVRPGDRIPLDGVVLEGESRIDTAPVTGEPVPVRAVPGDSVTSGCVNTSGQLKIRVEKILEESMVTRILDSVENAAASKPKIDRFITRFARIYTPFVIILALGTAILPSLVSGNWDYWVYTALTFLVMSCPCALVLSVPLAFFSGIGAGSKKGILFKGGVSLEAIKDIKTVILDKTGTITEGNFQVQKVLPAGAASQDEILAACAGCESSSTHPIALSIVTAAREAGLHIEQPSQVEEIAGHGVRSVLSSGEILCGNQKLMEKYHIDIQGYSPSAYGTEVLVAQNGTYIGSLVISDTIKPEAKASISALKKLGITPVMLTGDAKESALAVASETGIEEVHARLLPQDKLSRLTDIRSSHGGVMFVGDGINDAPVLAGADVGAAMGSGADAAIEAADVVFMTSSMEAIPQSIAIARKTNRISIQNVVFALIVKAVVMVLGLCGFASMWMAVFADTGVAMLCVLNSIRVLYSRKF